MERRDTAVTFFLLGLVCGMIVAFASCSTAEPDRHTYQPQTVTERQQQAITERAVRP